MIQRGVNDNVGTRYYTLQYSMQIQSSALLDNGTLPAGDFKSGSVFIKGFYHIRVDPMHLNVYMLYEH